MTNPHQQPASGSPAPDYSAQGYPAQGYPAPDYPAPGYPAPGYPAPGYPPGYGYPVPVAAPPTNGMAIAALVVACLGALGICGYGIGGIIGVVGAILGHVSRRQIRKSGEAGDGMALAGIIVGWIATAIAVITVIVIALIIFFAWLGERP